MKAFDESKTGKRNDLTEDFYDAQMADERISRRNSVSYSLRDVADKAGITSEELESFPEVELV